MGDTGVHVGNGKTVVADVPSLKDVIAPGLDILFVGINPSTYSAKVGHHFARSTNRFYRALFESGLTPRLYAPHEDGDLPGIGMGITNVAGRPTGMAQDLRGREYEAGRQPLRNKVRIYQPLIVAFAGRMAATGFYGAPRPVGPQEDLLEGARVFVAPSPSAANRAHHPDSELYEWYTRLREYRDSLKGRPPQGGDSEKGKGRTSNGD
jgi:TDG/mug DNA glycosylase family protein